MEQVLLRWFCAATLLFVLSACATWSEWEPSERIVGPIAAAGNARSKVMHRCTAGNVVESAYSSSGGRCKTAFKLPSGQLLDMADLELTIDNYLASLEGSASWPIRKHGSYSKYEPPYKFYLLSLEPTVVLVLPFPAGKYRGYGCGGPANGNRCVGSALLDEGYPYEELPKADSEAYWFSPGKTSGLVPVATQNGRYRFPTAIVNASLARIEGQWTFARE